jgi:hypothetical protein
MSTVKSRIEGLATAFANDVVRAIRSSSIEELLGGAVAGAGRDVARPKASVQVGAPTAARPRADDPARSPGGRLMRRSSDDIAQTLSAVVSLLKGQKEGLRSEQIRAALKLQANEMPRVLREGLAQRQLKSRGHKRATTYFAT